MKAYVFFGVIIFVVSACQKIDHGDISRKGEPLFEMSLLTTDGKFLDSKQLVTGKPFMLFFFEPDCPHCKRQLAEIIQYNDNLKGINVYMISVSDTMKLHWYESVNQLDVIGNIKVLQDTGLVLMKHFDIHTVPFSAIYNKKGILQGTYDHKLNEKLLKLISKA